MVVWYEIHRQSAAIRRVAFEIDVAWNITVYYGTELSERSSLLFSNNLVFSNVIRKVASRQLQNCMLELTFRAVLWYGGNTDQSIHITCELQKVSGYNTVRQASGCTLTYENKWDTRSKVND